MISFDTNGLVYAMAARADDRQLGSPDSRLTLRARRALLADQSNPE
jgi:hypothetical protein